jgi:hypothetical protein
MGTPDQPTGPPNAGQPNEPSEEIRERMRLAFQSVLDAAVPAYEIGQLRLFLDADERFIKEEVERKLYDPQLPNGGSKERRVIERLKRLTDDATMPDKVRNRARYAITQWERVLPADPRNAGHYYSRKPLKPTQDKESHKWLMEDLEIAQRNKDWDRKWFCQLMLDGLPEPVSDFEMECLFVLRKSDGTVDRLVRLRNVLGEVSKGPHHQGSDILDAEAFASPEKFRRWCLNHGNFAWYGNQVELQKLHCDNTHSNAWRVINQVDSLGSYKVGKTILWFCEECVYATPYVSTRSDGSAPSEPFVKAECLKPDGDGVFWWQGEGYYLNRRGRETDFQGKPKMCPDVSVGKLLGKPEAKEEESLQLLREFYREVSSKMFDTLGDHQGNLAIGAILSYSAGPELFAEHGLFPGLFIHGQAESGKTKYTEWLLHLRGFEKNGGIGILKATAVGLLCECENYSNEPVWADEYRNGKVSEEKEAILRDSYNRQPPVKWTAGKEQRVMRTSFVVSGESTSSDAATRSRFPHVQVSKSKRLGEHLAWMDANKHKFFLIGRFVMENRAQFVSWLRYFLLAWLKTPDLAGVNERERMVHGIDFASWMALNAILESHDAPEANAFKAFMVAHAKGSAADVSSETNIMIFLTDLLTAYKAEAIPDTCFKLESDHCSNPPGRPNQKTGWRNYKLYIDPEPTISAIRTFLAKQRSDITLRRKDLRDQLSKMPFWVEPAKGKQLKKRFRQGGSGGTPAWGFDLDKMGELGYLPCSDEEVQDYLLDANQGDPRKGPFFAIVDAIEGREEEYRKAVT